MTGEQQRVAVAVSTFQRRELLKRLVRGLEQQTLPRDRFEVVIVDNGSTDGTHEELLSLAAETPLALHIVRLDENRGPAAGRNAAWRATRAEIVAFTDDDCVPTPHWLESGLEAMARSNGIVVGRTLPDPDQLHHQGAFSRTVTVEGTRFLNTCNIFYRREDLDAVGGFDEGFTTPGGEDTDLGWRVAELGRAVDYRPEALVLHDVRPSSFRATWKETLRWKDVPRFVAMHPRKGRTLLYRRIFWKNSHPRTILALAGLVVSPLFPPAIALVLPWVDLRARTNPVDRERPMRFLPAAFAIDALEVFVMIRGSIRHRTLVL